MYNNAWVGFSVSWRGIPLQMEDGMSKWEILALTVILTIAMFLSIGAVYKLYPMPPQPMWDSTNKNQERVKP